jgi:polysaccharide export outer membrane protein
MRFFILFNIIPFIFITSLMSCSYRQEQALFEQRNIAAVVRESKSATGKYRLRPQDILQITNIQNNKSFVDLSAGVATINGSVPSLSPQGDSYLIEDDGTVALPALGRVPVAGLTRVEARQRIEELYGKDLKHPLLDVKIINLKVIVAGEVKSPGNIPLIKDRTTLIEILASAGGLTEKSDEKHIRIIRSENASHFEIIDLSDINTLTDPRIILQNDDIVYVAQNKKAIRNTNIQNFFTLAQPVLLIFSTTLLIFSLARK